MIRFFDIIFSVIAIIVVFPFMIPIMIGLKFTGEHYIFYMQPRVGRYGVEFNVVKFATMLKNSPNLPGGFITQLKDPRVLPMGSFLRKTKINELPQLLNILKGQMSVVGPRPIVAQHLVLYPEKTREAILTMTPGLTGIASLIFRDEEGVLDRVGGDRKYVHDNIIAPFKGVLEVWWTKHRTLCNYFKLIILTAWSLMRPRSTLWKRWFKDLPQIPDPLQKYL
ncbi:MAG: sugar transferase [Nitrospirota bacterium]|nr:sugar transferase [Nitrospirota bacterium]